MPKSPNTPPPHDPDDGRSAPVIRPVDLAGLKLHSIHERQHIAEIGAFARTPAPGASFAEWFASLPGFLGADRLRAAVDAIVAARSAGRPVIFALGAHVVKVGCGPILIDLMNRGVITAVVGHGATAIHDVEVAMIGATSEDVADTIRDGRFGMVRETAEFFARAARVAAETRSGYGAAIGRLINEMNLPHATLSVLAAAARLGLPATVHVAIGTDTVHMPAIADGAHIGAATLTDFRILCEVIAGMSASAEPSTRGRGGTDPDVHRDFVGASAAEGTHKKELVRATQPSGVWCNVGSAVLLPEVFLKALSVARNLGADLDHLVTINLDQLRHYRPAQNVVGRPVAKGRGLDITGHHELLLPLLRQAIIERL